MNLFSAVSSRISVIPTPYKILAYFLIFLAYTAFVFAKGVHHQKAEDALEQKKEVAAAFERGKKSVKVTDRVVTQYVDRVVKVKEEVVRYVDRVKYVVKDSDNFAVSAGVVGLFDDSLQNGLSFGPVQSDGAAGEATDAGAVEGKESTDFRTLLEVTAYNNGICKANAIQLEAIQSWVREQERVYKK